MQASGTAATTHEPVGTPDVLAGVTTEPAKAEPTEVTKTAKAPAKPRRKGPAKTGNPAEDHAAQDAEAAKEVTSVQDKIAAAKAKTAAAATKGTPAAAASADLKERLAQAEATAAAAAGKGATKRQARTTTRSPKPGVTTTVPAKGGTKGGTPAPATPKQPRVTSSKKAELQGRPPRTTFYLQVITRPMNAEQVAKELIAAGWPDEGMGQVVACLGYLTRKGRLSQSKQGDRDVWAPVKK